MADIVFPARLELTETQPGVFEVLFILPVINGKVLKASPVLPEACEYMTQPQISGTSFAKKLTWRIDCMGGDLFGKQIGIEGLQGSQVDILLIINLLDGRSYNQKLSPAMAYFVVPEPPGVSQLLKSGAMSGARSLLSNPLIYAIIFCLVFFLNFKAKTGLYVLLFISLLIGYWLGVFELLRTPQWMFNSTALAIILLLAFRMTRKSPTPFSPLIIIPPGLFLGNVLSLPEFGLVLTPGEEIAFGLFFSLGLGIACLLVITLFLKLKNILDNFSVLQYLLQPISILFGAASLGLLIYELSLFWNMPSMLPQIPAMLILFFTLLPFLKGSKNLLIPGLVFLIFSVIGLTGAMNKVIFPFSELVLLALILVSGLYLFFKKSVPNLMFLILFSLGSLLAGNILGDFANNNISYPLSRSVGYLILGFFWISIIGSTFQKTTHQKFLKAASVIFIGFGLLFLFDLFTENYVEGLHTEYLSGQLPLPLLSIFLMILSLVFWPRNRKVHQQMKLENRKPLISMSLMILALILLPFHINMNNPWFEAGELDQKGMERIMQNVLSNTYTAFNEEDEEKLFDELSKNVDTELLDNVYLDSRRRMNMGLREGAEVSVQEVKLDSLGDAHIQPDLESVEYPVAWTVTARVRHLKHIHYRKNRYIGNVALKAINNKWKISKISLTSEERKVIAASSL